jgi:hypothetical protein
MSILTRRRSPPSNRRQRGDQANGREPGAASRARIVDPSERCRADRIAERGGARLGSSGTPRHAARPRPRPRPSAGANMSRLCARKWPPILRRRANASSAAQPTTARGGESRSSACRALAKRRAHAPRPKRGRNAADVRTLASAADVRSSLAAAPVGATPSGPSEGEPPEGASGRCVRTGPRGQMPRGLKAARASVASIVP